MFVNKRSSRNQPRNQKGATLIEVLVTLLVLSVGLLGMAGLQAISIKSNHSSYYRSQATFLAYDITERMRANRTSALSGSYSSTTFPNSSAEHDVTGNRAAQDKAEWLNSLAVTLPSGTGKVQINSGVATIEIRWDDSRGAIQASSGNVNDTTQVFTYRTEI